MIDFESMANRLAENISSLKVGTNIMIDTMPISVTRGIILRSSLAGDAIDYEIPGLARGNFRMIVRSAKYQEGEELLGNAIGALTVHRPTQIGRMRVRYCRPKGTPVAFPLSEGNLREFMVNMEICYDFDVEKCPWLKTYR